MNNKKFPAVSLFVPGHLPGLLEQAFRMSINKLLLDQCRLVPADQKQSSRYLIGEAMREFAAQGKEISVWLNPLTLPDGQMDLKILACCPIHRLRVSGIHSPEDIEQLQALIDHHFAVGARPDLEWVVDHPVALERAADICRAARYLKAVTLSPGDFLTPAGDAAQQTAFILNLKQQIIAVARQWQVTPIDTINTNYRDLTAFAEDCRKSKQMGFAGRPVVHPGQVKIALEIY